MVITPLLLLTPYTTRVPINVALDNPYFVVESFSPSKR